MHIITRQDCYENSKAKPASVNKTTYVRDCAQGFDASGDCDADRLRNQNQNEIIGFTVSHGKLRFIVICQRLKLDFKRRRGRPPNQLAIHLETRLPDRRPTLLILHSTPVFHLNLDFQHSLAL